MRVRNIKKGEREQKKKEEGASIVNVKNTQLKRKKEVKFCQGLSCNLLETEMTIEGSDSSMLV